jgi:hypothetical protein
MAFYGKTQKDVISLWITNVYNRYRILKISVVKFLIQMERSTKICEHVI